MYTTMPTDNIVALSEEFPSRLVVMLYDEAIASLKVAIDAIGREDIESRFRATARTAEVISQLYLSLDMEQGGAIARNLGDLYGFILTQLPAINFHNDTRIAAQAIELLQPIRDSWSELDERIRASVADSESDMAMIAAAMATSEPALARTGS